MILSYQLSIVATVTTGLCQCYQGSLFPRFDVPRMGTLTCALLGTSNLGNIEPREHRVDPVTTLHTDTPKFRHPLPQIRMLSSDNPIALCSDNSILD